MISSDISLLNECSNGQYGIHAKVAWKVPTVQGQRAIHFRRKLCRYIYIFFDFRSYESRINHSKHSLNLQMSFACSGHYIPQLAEVMVEFNKKDKIFNLKGLAVRKTSVSSILLMNSGCFWRQSFFLVGSWTILFLSSPLTSTRGQSTSGLMASFQTQHTGFLPRFATTPAMSMSTMVDRLARFVHGWRTK